MSRYSWSVDGTKLEIVDNTTEGKLVIKFEPLDIKKGSELMWGISNDIVTDLEAGLLDLTLNGYSVIEVQKNVELKGKVSLHTAFLFDPIVEDSDLKHVSIMAKSAIYRSQLHSVGRSGFGFVKFIETSVNASDEFILPRGREIHVINNQAKVVVH